MLGEYKLTTRYNVGRIRNIFRIRIGKCEFLGFLRAARQGCRALREEIGFDVLQLARAALKIVIWLAGKSGGFSRQ